MEILILPEYEPLIQQENVFMAPLNSPEIRTIIRKYGIDNNYVKSYTIERVLRLYLFAGSLKGFFQSLRGIVSLSDNIRCRLFVGLRTWSDSGLSDANQRIPFTAFKEIYEHLSKQVDSPLSAPRLDKAFGDFKIFDCTHLALSLKLMGWGKKQNQRNKKGQLKIAMRIDEGGIIPDIVNLDPNIGNDNLHFKELIDWAKKYITYLFDRGFRCIARLVDIHLSGNFFITRLHGGTSFEVIRDMRFEKERRKHLEIIKDQVVRIGKGKNQSKVLFRLVTAVSYAKEIPEVLYFLTNRFDLEDFEIAAIYLYRWQIEIFFRWLKSNLKINRFFSYCENGVYLQIYSTLILNLLLAIYHNQKHLPGRLGINTQRDLFNQLWNETFWLGVKLGYFMNMNEEHPFDKEQLLLEPVKSTQKTVSEKLEILSHSL